MFSTHPIEMCRISFPLVPISISLISISPHLHHLLQIPLNLLKIPTIIYFIRSLFIIYFIRSSTSSVILILISENSIPGKFPSTLCAFLNFTVRFRSPLMMFSMMFSLSINIICYRISNQRFWNVLRKEKRPLPLVGRKPPEPPSICISISVSCDQNGATLEPLLEIEMVLGSVRDFVFYLHTILETALVQHQLVFFPIDALVPRFHTLVVEQQGNQVLASHTNFHKIHHVPEIHLLHN